MNTTILPAEMEALHFQLSMKKAAYKKALQDGVEFADLKKIYTTIKELEEKLEQCRSKSESPEAGKPERQ